MVCSKCGEKINVGLKFCTKCGSKIIIPGKLFLMVTGIIFIILALYGLFSQRFIFEYIRYFGLSIFKDPNFIRFFILPIIGSILSIIIGIFGIIYCKNIEKAKLLLCFAIIVLVFNIASFIFFRGFLWTSLIELILPVCFIIGAIMNLETKGGK